ncbi:hypothetical protein DUNSADRAFT_10664 [Dunaliella salina]|uniref:Encoded protein n=1 Tax=Dunaliella salina TaxID=3046 RepID=A0ABQ7GET5_DUNSA|nr:hypothetical protein DUNSADRAFT_10664 [Dunaliella salina]|eukprot:KAF5833114.1 hypothetical protein DUNSADRAFT_10664 [Dunaliella salina]
MLHLQGELSRRVRSQLATHHFPSSSNNHLEDHTAAGCSSAVCPPGLVQQGIKNNNRTKSLDCHISCRAFPSLSFDSSLLFSQDMMHDDAMQSHSAVKEWPIVYRGST